MQKIIPFLWFNDNAEDAINFYVAAFKNAGITSMRRAGGAIPGEKGKLFTATFQLGGSAFYALNGGPVFNFTPAVSFYVSCETHSEVDELWEKLSEGGKVLMPLNKYPFSEKYGWVQDKFGVSWQLNFTGAPQKVAPCLMFVKEQQGKDEEAIGYYTSVFNDSSLQMIAHFGAGEGGAEGTVKHAAFSLGGVEFIAMDGGVDHAFTFTPAISFFVACHTQEEVDYFWGKLSVGGATDRCGWLVDKYGVSWQIVPDALERLLYSSDPAKSKRVMDAMLKMTKLEIKGLQDAYDQA